MTSTSGSLLLARTQVWWHVFGVILMEILTEANLWPNLCLDSHTKAKQAIKCNKNFFNQCPEEKQITQLLTQYCINTPVKFSLVCDMPPSYEEWGEWRLGWQCRVLMAELLHFTAADRAPAIPTFHSYIIPILGVRIKEKNEPLFLFKYFSFRLLLANPFILFLFGLPFQQSALTHRVLISFLACHSKPGSWWANTD